ncbi:MAG TPA: hypothetical protein VJQ47_13960, partial [Steroidobacteraceae bacterium]|nr:hypothetical protein [Steroidobacteraceae bacterium]
LLRLQPHPLRGAQAAAERAELLLIYGDDNLGLLRARQRARPCVRQWCNQGRMLVLPGLDHSMFAPGARPSVQIHVRRFLENHLPPIQPPIP